LNLPVITGQSPIWQFEVGFAKLEEFMNNHDAVSFLDENKKIFSKLASWTAYVKSTSIEVLMKETTSSMFTLIRIKTLIDICLVTLSHYRYEEHADDDENADEADATVCSGVTGIEQHKGDDNDDMDE
jgi:hypothetical protein